jgi:vacuolar-type H+-ATPase subunit D/Vma8
MFLRSGLDTTPDITRVMRERENAQRAIWREDYLARQAAEKAAKNAASPGAKAHATMAAKKAKQLAANEKRKATIAAKQEEIARMRVAAQPMNEFGRKYYDGLREAYNVAGEEMHNFFEIFKSLGSNHENFIAYLRQNDPGIYIERIIENYWS